MFPCSHTFSLFAPLLHVINLLTTYKHTQFPPAKNKNKRRETFNLCDTSSQAFERNSQSIRVGWALELTLTFQVNHHNTFVHKLVKICLLPCSSWSSQWGICLLFVFPYTFTGFFDGDWPIMWDWWCINSFSVFSMIFSLTKLSFKKPYMSLTLISLSASSVKVNRLHTSVSKHKIKIALVFLVAVVTSCCNTYNFILQDEASEAR